MRVDGQLSAHILSIKRLQVRRRVRLSEREREGGGRERGGKRKRTRDGRRSRRIGGRERESKREQEREREYVCKSRALSLSVAYALALSLPFSPALFHSLSPSPST